MAKATASGRLRAWIESNLEFMATHRREMVAFSEIAVGSRGDAALSAAVAELSTAVAAGVEDMLAADQASGELREDFDPREIAGLFDAATPRAPRTRSR